MGRMVRRRQANRFLRKTDKTKLDGYGVQTRLYLPENYQYYFIYAHLSSAKTGRLDRSEIAGYVGRTGNITCEKTHLHFEVKDSNGWDITVDPAMVEPDVSLDHRALNR